MNMNGSDHSRVHAASPDCDPHCHCHFLLDGDISLDNTEAWVTCDRNTWKEKRFVETVRNASAVVKTQIAFEASSLEIRQSPCLSISRIAVRGETSKPYLQRYPILI